ncbi:MAG: PDZ domain-containing protein, partial [Longimicrobiales bacterium]
VRTPLDWEARLLDTRVGEPLDISVSDGQSRRTVRLSTQDLPSFAAERIRAGTDFEFVTLTPAIRAERSLTSDEGALIVSLSDDARSVGLREGDVIVEINRTPITSAQDAAMMLRRSGTIRAFFERQGQYGSVLFQIGPDS